MLEQEGIGKAKFFSHGVVWCGYTFASLMSGLFKSRALEV